MSELNKIIGKRIKKSREQKNYNIKTLSELANINFHTLSQIETGTTTVTVKNLYNLCEILGTNPDYLALGDFYEKIFPFLETATDSQKEKLIEILKDLVKVS